MDFPSFREALDDKIPKVNVIDRDEELVIEAELPGVEKDDLDVSLTENAVTIKASTRKEEKQEKGDEAKAAFKDGILTLTLPKAEQAKRVNIKVD